MSTGLGELGSATVVPPGERALTGMAEEVISDQEDTFSAMCMDEGHRGKRHAPPQEDTPNS